MRTRLLPFLILLFSLILCLTAFFLPLLFGCSFEAVSGIFSPARMQPMLLVVAAAAGASVLFRVLLYFKNKYNKYVWRKIVKIPIKQKTSAKERFPLRMFFAAVSYRSRDPFLAAHFRYIYFGTEIYGLSSSKVFFNIFFTVHPFCLSTASRQ